MAEITMTTDICEIISSYIHNPRYELLDWIDIRKLNLNYLSFNKNAIDFLRNKKKNSALSLDTKMENDEGQEFSKNIKSQTLDPEEHIIKKQKVEMLRDVVDKLKPRYKELVKMRYYEELSYEEIAVKLDLPVGTVKAQLFRARDFLYNILKNQENRM